MLDRFVKDCILWEGPHAGAGEECEEEGAAEAKHYELTTTPIPLCHSGGGGRRIRSEAEPRKKRGVGRKCLGPNSAGKDRGEESVENLCLFSIVDLHPVVANPYTLHTKLQDNQVWFTVLDLKDAFFCLPLAKESQNLFAFEGESPTTGRETQLTWTVLPQGFKNSPTIFGNQLARELETWDPPSRDGTLLQYVDDINSNKKPSAEPPSLKRNSGPSSKWQVGVNNPTQLIWSREAQNAFKTLKKELMKAPALGLPDVTKPFRLFSHEKQGIALGVLAQRLGLYKRAVAYFSKQLDEVSKGWPGCLRAVAAVVLNIQEAWKFTLGQKNHSAVSAVLEQKGNRWLSPSRFLQYQAILVEPDDVNIEVTNVTNPASFLSGVTSESLIHDCLETIETVYSSRPDLKEEPLEDAQDSCFTDGSSFVRQGIRKAGYAVTTASKVIESQSLPAGTSAQKAEIIALTRVLELAKGKKRNIWTDSKCAFGVVHAHGAIWKERGLLTAQGRQIKHAEEILHLSEAVQLPTKVAIMHCRGHLKGNTDQEKGNRLADYEAKQAAETMQKILTLIPDNRSRSLGDQENVEYSRADKELIEEMGGQVPSKGWAHLSDGRIIIPAKQVTQQCEICLKNNLNTGNRAQLGSIVRGNVPGDHWQIDFSELPRKGGYRYLLVLTDTFSGWPEAFPCRTNKAREVTKVLLNEIIPRFGVPMVISSDKGYTFLCRSSATGQQAIRNRLAITHTLQTTSQQASRKNENNRYLKYVKKQTYIGIQHCLLHYFGYVAKENLSPFEILYGKPYQAKYQGEDLNQLGNNYLQNYVISLGKQLERINKTVLGARAKGLDHPIHPFSPGDWVYVKNFSGDPLEEKWNGPYQLQCYFNILRMLKEWFGLEGTFKGHQRQQFKTEGTRHFSEATEAKGSGVDDHTGGPFLRRQNCEGRSAGRERVPQAPPQSGKE
ncbi:LOW QUALITY PROTEIN: hypothetical protein QYF61_008832 [Mycteria americana]|uniref:ribonuclease H n=1 Tax=Mycteria americana TaxID=33587 RepID=A0AAN7RPJ1_MYCAM|nr:LOW QUALITY PROTEIN: hypothetical protein QYF61_008832 [Mycteria americana]